MAGGEEKKKINSPIRGREGKDHQKDSRGPCGERAEAGLASIDGVKKEKLEGKRLTRPSERRCRGGRRKNCSPPPMAGG